MSMLEEIIRHTRRQIVSGAYTEHGIPIKKPNGPGALTYFRARESVQKRTVISEFKRRSPSAGQITDTSIETILARYRKAGSTVHSVLTNKDYFSGSLADLKTAVSLTSRDGGYVLMKDFIIDEEQINAAATIGADMVLLIVRILTDEQLHHLYRCCMMHNILPFVEVHNEADINRIHSLQPALVGINHRDLDHLRMFRYRSALYRHVLSPETVVIAESGISDITDSAFSAPNVHGYLIGHSLLTHENELIDQLQKGPRRFLKVCGIRNIDTEQIHADWIGFNLSPHSKRRVNPLPDILESKLLGQRSWVLFRQHLDILADIPVTDWVQVYADDVSKLDLQHISQRKLLTVRGAGQLRSDKVRSLLPWIDGLIIDGLTPGSGIPHVTGLSHPYPHLEAGGITIDNVAERVQKAHCVGVDVATGIETNGQVDIHKVNLINSRLKRSIEEPC